jgi:hypothetical protein
MSDKNSPLFLKDEISFTWHIDDVEWCADQRNINLSPEDCREVLSIMDKRHDATIGCNWDFINCCIDEFLSR